MEEINLKDLFNFFVKKIPMILFITIVVFTLGVTYTVFLKTPLYKGDTTLILVQNESSKTSMGITQTDLAVNQKLVATYSELIKSRKVLNQVVDKLKLDYSAQELSEKISVSSVSDTEIIKISVSDENAKDAAKIADTIAVVFETEVMEIYKLENVSLIDKAEVQENPYNIQIVKEFVIYFAVGLVLACGIAFAIYCFDDSIKSSEEVEAKLGIPVIGNIPLSTSGKGGK